ncbi:hypothetical protein C3E97_027695 [Pseudomonas sp. MWU12-2115]|uniref:hypothetical protein n=1 Tax=unclassified Pseudomonas TaxID=196821 RepID=UPI000CD49F30|nr:hypothetical protein [Pseudomonas sp. MWU12-2020]RBB97503.1 hypothetical protein C3E97_027695 [Pseudomonas sp. MWU12-2115]
MNKYLYGKKQYLKDWIEGKQGLRLSDIAYYSIMENDQMRDNELAKEFVYDKEQVTFSVNGRKLNPQDMTANPVMTLSPSRCFCVCLSGKRNDPELFERFKADTCIEVDVLHLVEILKAAFSILEGVEVIHRDVSYYPSIMESPVPDLMSVLFYKRDIYSVENEYRIAVTIPAHRKYFQDQHGARIAIFSDDPGDMRHVFVNGVTADVNTSYIVSVGSKGGAH